MESIKIANIEIWIKDDVFTARYTDEGGGSGDSEQCDYIEEAVTEAIEEAKKFRMDEALMDAAANLFEKEDD